MMKLKEIQNNEDMQFAFETYEIPDYVLEQVPEDQRSRITGAAYELIDGELGEVFLTEDLQPYDLNALYYEAKCYA